MLLTIIIALIFTLSLIFIIVYRYRDSLLNLITWIVSTISGAVLLIMIIVITETQIRSYNEYKQAVSERETIVVSLEAAESPEFLTTRVIEFNNKVISAKQWTGVWFGWFVNERLTTLDEIDIEDYITERE